MYKIIKHYPNNTYSLINVGDIEDAEIHWQTALLDYKAKLITRCDLFVNGKLVYRYI